MAEDPAAQPPPTALSDVPAAEPAAVPAAPEPTPAAVPVPDTGYTPAGVPTLEGVREKIETRFGTAFGATELAEDTLEGRTAALQFDARQKAAEDKLAQIRAAMPKPD